MDVGRSVNEQPRQSTAEQGQCACFLGYILYNSMRAFIFPFYFIIIIVIIIIFIIVITFFNIFIIFMSSSSKLK